jgi:hypothetical protein
MSKSSHKGGRSSNRVDSCSKMDLSGRQTRGHQRNTIDLPLPLVQTLVEEQYESRSPFLNYMQGDGSEKANQSSAVATFAFHKNHLK